MKTRIALGLLASLAALLTAAPDAGAATKKRGESAAATAAAGPDTKAPKKKAASGKKRTKKATSHAGSVKPASLMTETPATKPASGKRAGTKKPASANAPGATKPASLVNEPPSTKPASGKRAGAKKPASAKTGATKPASLSAASPEPATKRASPSAVSATPAAKQATLVTPEPAAKRLAAPGPSRFLASGVPLAEVREGRLAAVGTRKRPCGAKSRWAKASSRWHALDAWGHITGTLTVGGSDRDDGSGCHQVLFQEGTGRDTLGVFVAAGSGYAAAPSAEWKPAADVAKRFDALYATQEGAWVDGRVPRTREQERRRTLYFELPRQEGGPEGAPSQRRPSRWAVSGGRVLLVGYVGESGAWKVGHVLSPTGKDHAYEPLAILDMNGDGLPEIVVHEEASGVYVDRVLSFDAGTMRWENAVASPGGAIR